MNRIKFWPHATLVVVGCALIAGMIALFWTKYERKAEASALPNAARVERVDGQVGLNHSNDNTAGDAWIAATANTPVSVGDRVYTKDSSRAEVAFTGRNFATIEANTSLDVLDLSNQRTQVALRDGSALFDVGSIASGELFEVATPCGAVDFDQPGIYQITIKQDGNAVATAFSGEAQLVGQGGSGRIEKGEMLTVPCQGSSGAVMSRVDAGQAGSLIDNYYRYRYPRKYDGRYRNYYTYLDDPYYYDPYRSYASYNYVSEYVPGIDDLDDYGDWQYVSDYGYAWHPRVDAAWAPYQAGNWMMDYPYGLTWVSNEPWGYAPYHYGRWAYASNEWFWVPEPARAYPVYSPALVAFIPLSQSSVAWVALGPGDPYSSWYYDPNWQPVYLNPTNVIQERIVNLSVPGAVTVVDTRNFDRVIDASVITRVDPQTIARVHPVLDPLAVDSLRRAAFETRAGQRRIDMPQGIAQRLNNTPVVTGTAPVAPPFRRDLARALRVESVPDRAKNQKLNFRDERAAMAANPPAPNITAEQARERQMAELARQASRGDRSARTQLNDLRRQQVEQQRAERTNAQQAQGERVRQQMQTANVLRQQQQAQREAARQQMITNQQQQRRQTEIQRTQQKVIRHSEQQQPVKSQPQSGRRKPPVQYQPPQVSGQLPAPMRQQNERKVAPARLPAPQARPAPVRVRPPQPQAQPHPQPQVERQQKPAAQPQPQKKKTPEKP